MAAVAVVHHHRHAHIAHVEGTAVHHPKLDGASGIQQILHPQIAGQAEDPLQRIEHQPLQLRQLRAGVFVVQVAAVAQVGAAAMQMQVGAALGHRHPPLLGVGVEKATALPLQRGAQIADRIGRIAGILGRQPVVLQQLINALSRRGLTGGAPGDRRVTPLLAHAQLGRHGDHQPLPAGQQPQAIDRRLGQPALAAQPGDRLPHQLLQRPAGRIAQPCELGGGEGGAQGSGIAAEAHVGEVAAAIAGAQGPDAATAGLALPDGGVTARLLQKGELAVVEAGGGAQAQHIAAEGDALQGQVLAHIPLDQVAHRVGDPEISRHPDRLTPRLG